ncbi:MAG: YicC family protein [Candidatus Hydrogenedentes bacterium]|nr:YicC family protein [Candidatus Hydrogenedentota bacterium]
MAKSMTGFARNTASIAGKTVTIEISSVNHRFLDCSIRLPGPWVSIETSLRECIKKHVSRGKLNVFVRHGRGTGITPPIHLDQERAMQYIEASRKLMHEMRSTDALSLNTLITLDGVMSTVEEEPDMKAVENILASALEEALGQLNDMRAREGNALVEALSQHLKALHKSMTRVEERASELTASHEERLRRRMEEINAEVGVKEERLAMEVAVMAERMDVTEELVRLKAHIEHAHDIMAADSAIGRDLNFLTQEMQREVNTLGAKLRSVDTSRDIIEMKGEVEKFREQVQNIE